MAGERKRRAVCVVEVSADHYTALGRCSRVDGLTSTSLEDVHMELHSCTSASIHGQLLARNVAHTRVQEPKRFTFPAPSARRSTYYQGTNFLNARGAIEAEPWRGVLLIVTARWTTGSFLERAIYRLSARGSVRVEYQHTHSVRQQRKR